MPDKTKNEQSQVKPSEKPQPSTIPEGPPLIVLNENFSYDHDQKKEKKD